MFYIMSQILIYLISGRFVAFEHFLPLPPTPYLPPLGTTNLISFPMHYLLLFWITPISETTQYVFFSV